MWKLYDMPVTPFNQKELHGSNECIKRRTWVRAIAQVEKSLKNSHFYLLEMRAAVTNQS